LQVGKEQPLRRAGRLGGAAEDDLIRTAEVRRLVQDLDRTGHVLQVHVRK
jgi:hypothetical protein